MLVCALLTAATMAAAAILFRSIFVRRVDDLVRGRRVLPPAIMPVADRARQIAISARTGRSGGITLLNIATMGGVFVSQSVTGFLIDLFPNAERGMRSTHIGLLFCLPDNRYLVGMFSLFFFTLMILDPIDLVEKPCFGEREPQ